jgi:arylsulfatase A-like enzyme
MIRTKRHILGLVVLLIAFTAAGGVGKLASATTTDNTEIDRSALPIPDPTYPAVTTLDVRNAPSPPPRFVVTPPKGAPNVIVILLDNLGYSASKTFGGVVNMPTLDRLAQNGLIYTNFHTAPLCSPSRLALLTGRNTHSVNMGSIAEFATAYQGQTAVRPNEKATLAEILLLNGYSTAMFGKDHEFTPWEASAAGPFDSWPTGQGFQKFYGTLSGEADLFAPANLYDNSTRVDAPNDPNYYYQTDLADHAIAWIRTQKTLAPDRPFFIYYATPGTHSPVQVPQAWLNRYSGKFDEGWDKAREQTLKRQIALGIVPSNTKLTPKPSLMKDWDKLTPDEKKLFERHQEIFAAFAEETDHEVGRVLQATAETGQLDNTLIIYVTGDNGSSANGGPIGVFNTFHTFNSLPETVQYQLSHLAEFGGPKSEMTPPLGWAIADNTPFAYAQGVTSYGGTTNGAVISWPKYIKQHGIRPQYTHLIDVAPTVLEAAQIPEPKTVYGVTQNPIEGVSMLYTFNDPQAKARHTIQYYEFLGNRGIYEDGWYATTLHRAPWDPKPRATFDTDKWELYNTVNDFSCAVDIAAQNPDKLKELQALFLTEAVKYNVLPLDDRAYERFNAAVAGRPDLMAGRTSLTVYQGMVGMKEDAFINVKNRSHTIMAVLDVPQGGASGVVLAQGGIHLGWSLYIKDGAPRYAYNYFGAMTTIASKERLPSGKVTLRYEFAYDGGKPGSGGIGTIFVNGKKVASGRIARTIPTTFGPETIDVGTDLQTAVTTDYPRVNNKFTGTIESVTITLLKMSPADEATAKQEDGLQDEADANDD